MMFSIRRVRWSSLTTFSVLLALCQISVCVHEDFIRNCSFVPTISFKEGQHVDIIYQNESYKEAIVTGVPVIEFTCRSKLPVDFRFKGPLANFLESSHTRRYTATLDWDKLENFCYETVIKVLAKLEATGEYNCSVVSNRGKGTTSLYLYSPGGSKQTILTAGTTEKVEISEANKTVVIPCRVKLPNITTSLEKDGVKLNETDYEYYDPQLGYVLKVKNILDVIGHYKCQAVNSETWDHVNITVDVNETKRSIDGEAVPIPIITIEDGVEEHKNQSIFTCNNNKTEGIRSFVYVKCFTPTECGVAANALENGLPLNTYIHFTKEGRECSRFPERENDCKMIPLQDIASAGILRCQSNNKTEKTTTFYTDLNGKLVFEKHFVPLPDTLQIAHIPYNWEIQKDIWYMQKINVTCRASKFNFSIGIKWFFILKNGTVISHPPTEDLPSIERNDSYYSATALVTISDPNIEKLGCMAPVLDSVEWENVFIKLDVRNSSMPVFPDPSDQTVYFDMNDKNQMLSCEAKGLPSPTINWLINGTEEPWVKKHIFYYPSNDTVIGSFNPELTPEHNGTFFICNATNVRGSINKTITVLFNKRAESGATFSMYIIGAIIVIVLVFVLMAAMLLRLCWRQDNYVRLSKTEEQNFLYGEKITKEMDVGTQTDLPQPSPYAMVAYEKDKYEVSENKLTRQERIGDGQFGVVYRYIMKGPEGDIDVACKTIKNPNDEEAFSLLLEEIKILQHVGYHPNVVRLVGAVTKDIRKLQAFVLVEYCRFGNLKQYLEEHRGSFQSEISKRGNFQVTTCAPPIGNYVLLELYVMKTSDLIRWSHEIACGMEYLGEKKLIHRDLAARNVVLDTARVAKITDFGLCKNLEKNTGENAGKDYYRFTPGKKNPLLPLPWLAPEIIGRGRCSVSSDIWAYGVTLWEIFSLGDQPYSAKTTADITASLEKGERLEKPQFSNSAIYDVMLDCWKQVPEERPRFSELKTTFANLQARLSESSSMEQSDGEENSDEGNMDSDANETVDE